MANGIDGHGHGQGPPFHKLGYTCIRMRDVVCSGLDWVVIGFHAGDTVYRTNTEFDLKGDSTSMRATSENGT